MMMIAVAVADRRYRQSPERLIPVPRPSPGIKEHQDGGGVTWTVGRLLDRSFVARGAVPRGRRRARAETLPVLSIKMSYLDVRPATAYKPRRRRAADLHDVLDVIFTRQRQRPAGRQRAAVVRSLEPRRCAGYADTVMERHGNSRHGARVKTHLLASRSTPSGAVAAFFAILVPLTLDLLLTAG